MSIDELFRHATHESIRVITKSGAIFVIEAADEFEQEIAQLRASPRFMAFLAQRSQEKAGSISLDAFEQEIEAEIAQQLRQVQSLATDERSDSQ
ncbi:MAG: hypothetical protein AB4911_24090 [Oscillochloridaceae bacterium umkhey_bin13]